MPGPIAKATAAGTAAVRSTDGDARKACGDLLVLDESEAGAGMATAGGAGAHSNDEDSEGEGQALPYVYCESVLLRVYPSQLPYL